MMAQGEAHREVLTIVPSRRTCAISLIGNTDRADDPVQEVITHRWGNLDKFQRGTERIPSAVWFCE